MIQVGTRQPLGVGAAGLALLSALADRDVEAVIDVNAPTLALYGGMTQARLRALVAATRQTLYRHISPSGQLRSDGTKLLSKA